jgi:hypothetical protein
VAGWAAGGKRSGGSTPAPVSRSIIDSTGKGRRQAFEWLNAWADERFDRLRQAQLTHSWRLKEPVTYQFDWIARCSANSFTPAREVHG